MSQVLAIPSEVPRPAEFASLGSSLETRTQAIPRHAELGSQGAEKHGLRRLTAHIGKRPLFLFLCENLVNGKMLLPY